MPCPALRIADRGLTVLRLDYLGTRESGVGYAYYLDDMDEWLALGRRRLREAELRLGAQFARIPHQPRLVSKSVR